jgi:hypothetical protein
MRPRPFKNKTRLIGRTALCAALGLLLATLAEARAPFALLQAARGLQESPASAEESSADRAARALNDEQRAAARKVRLAQIALIEQVMQMEPEQRQRFLEENPRIQRLPAPQQRRLQQLTQRLSRLPAEEQLLVLERYRLFLDLAPQKQQQARRIYQHWRGIEPARRRELLSEIEQLRDATPQARHQRLQSEAFSKSYSVQEQRIVRVLSGLFP